MVGPLTGLVRCLLTAPGTAHAVRVESVEAALDPVLIVGVILIGVLMVAVPELVIVTLHLEPGEGGAGGVSGARIMGLEGSSLVG